MRPFSNDISIRHIAELIVIMPPVSRLRIHIISMNNSSFELPYSLSVGAVEFFEFFLSSGQSLAGCSTSCPKAKHVAQMCL